MVPHKVKVFVHAVNLLDVVHQYPMKRGVSL